MGSAALENRVFGAAAWTLWRDEFRRVVFDSSTMSCGIGRAAISRASLELVCGDERPRAADTPYADRPDPHIQLSIPACFNTLARCASACFVSSHSQSGVFQVYSVSGRRFTLVSMRAWPLGARIRDLPRAGWTELAQRIPAGSPALRTSAFCVRFAQPAIPQFAAQHLLRHLRQIADIDGKLLELVIAHLAVVFCEPAPFLNRIVCMGSSIAGCCMRLS